VFTVDFSPGATLQEPICDHLHLVPRSRMTELYLHSVTRLLYFTSRTLRMYCRFVVLESQPMFRRNFSPPSSESKNKPSKLPACYPLFSLVSCLAYSSTLKV
jgi:hypothetical protein